MKIHLPPEFKALTLHKREQIRPGLHLWPFGMFSGINGYPKEKHEVCLVSQKWNQNAKCSVMDENYFVMSELSSSGSFTFMQNYQYSDWNMGHKPYPNNWYLARSKEDADAVFEYLIFISRVLQD